MHTITIPKKLSSFAFSDLTFVYNLKNLIFEKLFFNIIYLISRNFYVKQLSNYTVHSIRYSMLVLLFFIFSLKKKDKTSILTWPDVRQGYKIELFNYFRIKK